MTFFRLELLADLAPEYLCMTIESQNIEFKESWRDEYQKWICGFANAQGGALYVGVKDNGEVCGVRCAGGQEADGGHS